MQVLIVDGANVVGSRPDGWWRDRAGAAHRLHDQLSTADLPEGHEIRRNPAGARAFCDCPEGAVGALWSDTIGRDRCAATTNPGMDDSEF